MTGREVGEAGVKLYLLSSLLDMESPPWPRPVALARWPESWGCLYHHCSARVQGSPDPLRALPGSSPFTGVQCTRTHPCTPIHGPWGPSRNASLCGRVLLTPALASTVCLLRMFFSQAAYTEHHLPLPYFEGCTQTNRNQEETMMSQATLDGNPVTPGALSPRLSHPQGPHQAPPTTALSGLLLRTWGQSM